MSEDNDANLERKKEKKAVEATYTDDGKTKEISIRYEDGSTEKIHFKEQSRMKVASRYSRYDDHVNNTESEGSNNKETEKT